MPENRFLTRTFFLGYRRTGRPLRQRLPRMLNFIFRLLTDQESLLFQPHHRPPGSPEDFDLEIERVGASDGGTDRFHGWWLAGKEPSKAVLLLPGATGNPAHELPALSFLDSLGLSALALEYPGCGRSQGKPGVVACRQTAVAGWDYLVHDRGFAPSDVILYGRSLGSAFAAELAARGCGGLVFHNGISSVAELAALSLPSWLVRGFCTVRLDSLPHIRQCRCPVLVLHAEDDQVIPWPLGRRVYQEANLPKRFLDLTGGHFNSGWRDDPRVRASWNELLSGAATEWAGSDSEQRNPLPRPRETRLQET